MQTSYEKFNAYLTEVVTAFAKLGEAVAKEITPIIAALVEAQAKNSEVYRLPGITDKELAQVIKEAPPIYGGADMRVREEEESGDE